LTLHHNRHGYIVVETIGSFILFVLLIISILSLVNIVALQARLHYALTQSAQTLSIYSYILEVTGTADHLTNLAAKADKTRLKTADLQASVNGIIDGFTSLDPTEIGRQGQDFYSITASWLDDPQETIQLLVDYGLDEAKNIILIETILRPLMGRYLSNGNMDGDTYLKSVNVRDGLAGLNFYSYDLKTLGTANSLLIDSNGDIKLVIRYEVDYMFGALPLPFEPKLQITQTVKTKAWLGGKGKGYPK